VEVSRPYALTYGSRYELSAGALIDALTFRKYKVPRLGSPPTLDGAQAKRRFDRGDDDVKQKPCQSPVADEA
jgi:hypothetical protein